MVHHAPMTTMTRVSASRHVITIVIPCQHLLLNNCLWKYYVHVVKEGKYQKYGTDGGDMNERNNLDWKIVICKIKKYMG